ncbi:MAG TPA: hypothetical protein VFG20_14545 [Planctomycetaceae bacterium]|nr:hypothetical protein [Planctomycetaceae bacterium]
MADSLQLLRQWTVLRTLSARRQGVTLRELAADTGVSEDDHARPEPAAPPRLPGRRTRQRSRP